MRATTPGGQQPLRPGFVAMLEQARVEPFERLAALLRQRLDARGARADGRPIRPFGWRGWADTKWRPAHAAIRRAKRALLKPR